MQACSIIHICDTLFIAKPMILRPVYFIPNTTEYNVMGDETHHYAILPKYFEGLPEKVTGVAHLQIDLPYKLYSPEELYPLLPKEYSNDLRALMELKKNIPPKYPKLFVIRNSPDKNVYIYNTQTITF